MVKVDILLSISVFVGLEKTGLDIVLLLNITHLYCTFRSKSFVIVSGNTSLLEIVGVILGEMVDRLVGGTVGSGVID